MLIATAISSVWGAIAGYLKVSRGIHEVISTIMLNYIGTGIIAYLLGQVFNDEDAANLIPQTTPLPETGQIPSLNNLLNIEDLPSLHGFLPIAIFLGLIYYFLIWKTTLGYNLRITGQNPTAAKFSGVDPKRLTMLAMGYFRRFCWISWNGSIIKLPSSIFNRFSGRNWICWYWGRLAWKKSSCWHGFWRYFICIS